MLVQHHAGFKHSMIRFIPCYTWCYMVNFLAFRTFLAFHKRDTMNVWVIYISIFNQWTIITYVHSSIAYTRDPSYNKFTFIYMIPLLKAFESWRYIHALITFNVIHQQTLGSTFMLHSNLLLLTLNKLKISNVRPF